MTEEAGETSWDEVRTHGEATRDFISGSKHDPGRPKDHDMAV
jgi:hypothetical protein